MNVYDTVNKLAQELKEADEYKNLKKYKELINTNAEVKEKIKKFQTLRYEIQIGAMQGAELNKEKETELQELYTELLSKENVKEYFDAEVKLNVVLADVNKIIGEAVKDLLD